MLYLTMEILIPVLSVLPGLVIVQWLSKLIMAVSSLLHFLMLLIAYLVVVIFCWCRKSYFLVVIGFGGVFGFWLTDLNKKVLSTMQPRPLISGSWRSVLSLLTSTTMLHAAMKQEAATQPSFLHAAITS